MEITNPHILPTAFAQFSGFLIKLGWEFRNPHILPTVFVYILGFLIKLGWEITNPHILHFFEVGLQKIFFLYDFCDFWNFLTGILYVISRFLAKHGYHACFFYSPKLQPNLIGKSKILKSSG